MTGIAPISSVQMKERFSAALRLYVGRDRRFSRDLFAEATGFDRSTVDKYCDGEQMPCAAKLFTIMCVIGEPRFVNALLELAGFAGAVRLEDGFDTMREGMRLCSVTSKFLGKMIEHRTDGRITPQEGLEEANAAEEVGNKIINFGRNARQKLGAA